MTLRSRAEPKPRVGCSADGATRRPWKLLTSKRHRHCKGGTCGLRRLSGLCQPRKGQALFGGMLVTQRQCSNDQEDTTRSGHKLGAGQKWR